MDTRAKQRLRAADALKAPHDVERERHEGIVTAVRHLVLDLRPDELIRIELRRVAREAVDFQPGVPAEKHLDVLTAVDFPAVPQEHDRTPEMAEELTQERDDLGAGDVVGVQICAFRSIVNA